MRLCGTKSARSFGITERRCSWPFVPMIDHPPKTEPDPDELLTVDQVAPILKVIPDTVRSWIQSGTLRASRPGNGARPGRKYRIRRADLDAFVASSQGLPRSPEAVRVSETARTSGRMADRTP